MEQVKNDTDNPVHYAACNGDVAYLQLMMRTKGSQEVRMAFSKKNLHFKLTPLHCAAYFNHPQCVKTLLRMRVEVNVECECGRTPLELTSNPVIEYLLTHPNKCFDE